MKEVMALVPPQPAQGNPDNAFHPQIHPAGSKLDKRAKTPPNKITAAVTARIILSGPVRTAQGNGGGTDMRKNYSC